MASSIINYTIHFWSRLRTRIYSLFACQLFGECGTETRISPPFRFSNLHRVRIGAGVTISASCWIMVTGDVIDSDPVRLDIGPGTNIGMGATISAAKKIVIGDHVLFARNVYISDHGHAYEDVSRSIMSQGIAQVAPVYIGRHTWLGQNVSVLPGVTIGEHCVIGANSVVKHSIPDFSVAVGSPARVVKQFNRETSRWEKVGSSFARKSDPTSL